MKTNSLLRMPRLVERMNGLGEIRFVETGEYGGCGGCQISPESYSFTVYILTLTRGMEGLRAGATIWT